MIILDSLGQIDGPPHIGGNLVMDAKAVGPVGSLLGEVGPSRTFGAVVRVLLQRQDDRIDVRTDGGADQMPVADHLVEPEKTPRSYLSPTLSHRRPRLGRSVGVHWPLPKGLGTHSGVFGSQSLCHSGKAAAQVSASSLVRTQHLSSFKIRSMTPG